MSVDMNQYRQTDGQRESNLSAAKKSRKSRGIDLFEIENFCVAQSRQLRRIPGRRGGSGGGRSIKRCTHKNDEN